MIVLKRIVCTFLMMSILCMPVMAADTPYTPFTYNEWKTPLEGPSGYEPTMKIDSSTLDVGGFSSALDIAVSRDGSKLYILDTGNNRVVVTDSSFKTGKVINKFNDTKTTSTLNNPTGIFIDNHGDIYIADKDNSRVICCDDNGIIKKQLVKPKSELFPQDKSFSPMKIAVDKNGIAYVICEGIDSGAVMFSEKCTFLGFFGSNKVSDTMKARLNRLLKLFLSKSARNKLSKLVPNEFKNICIDREGFIYTCSDDPSPREVVKKLNSSGINILLRKAQRSFQYGFGDVSPIISKNKIMASRLIDLAVNENGYIFCLDSTTGRIYEYDQEANLVFSFGGLGTQTGLFLTPAAIECMGDRILVLDRGNSSITVFTETEFGKTVYTAMSYYSEGKYSEALKPWNDVLKYDSNYKVAYIGIGKALLESGDLEGAIKNFKIANYSSGYDAAFKEYRLEKMRKYFPFYFFAFILLILFVYCRKIPLIPWILNRGSLGKKNLYERRR